MNFHFNYCVLLLVVIWSNFSASMEKAPDQYKLADIVREFPKVFNDLSPKQQKLVFKNLKGTRNLKGFLNELQRHESRLFKFKWERMGGFHRLSSDFDKENNTLFFYPLSLKGQAAKDPLFGARFEFEDENLTSYLRLEKEHASLAPEIRDFEAAIKELEPIVNKYKQLADLEKLGKGKLTASEKEKHKQYEDKFEAHKANKAITQLKQKQLRKKQAETVSRLEQKYEIYLMPKGDLTVTLRSLLEAIEIYKDLQPLISRIKISTIPHDKIVAGVILPRIVIYLSAEKMKAQQALDDLYEIFDHYKGLIKGLNITPRYSAKVTDLIYVAQGDSNLKADKYASFYEPGRIYYHPYFSGTEKKYYLKHPETGKDLNS